jgi:formylglycine-generating enzyme required for sulfatase activity
VQERIHRARNIEQWTLVDAAGAWEEARRAIAGNARYRNLDLKPQVGLVPLGPNAAGLWEFWVRDMGPVPADAGCAEARGGIVLVLIPGGDYWIGSPPDEDGRNGDEENLHCRSLAPYFIGKCEVTQRAWTQVMGENLAAYHPDSPLSTAAFTDLHPIENVSRHEVEGFCRRLALSIPTEAQWETAARGGREGPYAFESLKGNENVLGQELRDFESLLPSLKGEMNDWPDSHMYHAPVGTFSPNGYGLHDVCGNVSEWCRDGYQPRPDEIIDTDPDGLLAPAPYMDRHNDSVTFRGGSWRSHAKDARCATRHRIRGVFFYSHVGLRAARAVDP